MATKKTTRTAGGKVPTRAAAKPQPKPAAKPAAKAVPNKKNPVEPKVLKGVMTERRLKAITDKNGFISFLLVYPLGFFLETENVQNVILRDCEAVACPSDQYDLGELVTTAYEVNRKKNTVTLLIKTKVVKDVQVPPPPPAVVVEEPATPASPPEPKADVDKTEVPVKATVSEAQTTKSFDASPWFSQAKDADIVGLATQGLRNTPAAEAVVEFCRGVDPTLDAYISETVTGTIVGSGVFEVEVDEDQMLEWVEAFGAHLLPQLSDIKDAQESHGVK